MFLLFSNPSNGFIVSLEYVAFQVRSGRSVVEQAPCKWATCALHPLLSLCSPGAGYARPRVPLPHPGGSASAGCSLPWHPQPSPPRAPLSHVYALNQTSPLPICITTSSSFYVILIILWSYLSFSVSLFLIAKKLSDLKTGIVMILFYPAWCLAHGWHAVTSGWMNLLLISLNADLYVEFRVRLGMRFALGVALCSCLRDAGRRDLKEKEWSSTCVKRFSKPLVKWVVRGPGRRLGPGSGPALPSSLGFGAAPPSSFSSLVWTKKVLVKRSELFIHPTTWRTSK